MMCGLVGIVNYKKNLSDSFEIIHKMNQTLSKRGPDEEGYFINECVNLAHKRLSIIDIDGGKQPMSAYINGNTYTIVYNGQLYNTDEIRNELKEHGFTFDRTF